MRAIEIFRLRRVRDKPGALAVLAHAAALAPDAARRVINSAVGGARTVVHLPDDARARTAIQALARAGFVARFAFSDDGELAQLAQVAVLAVQHRLTGAVSDAVGALLLADAWEAALDQALQHLRHHTSPDDPDRALLERTAIEVGLVAGVPGRA